MCEVAQIRFLVFFHIQIGVRSAFAFRKNGRVSRGLGIRSFTSNLSLALINLPLAFAGRWLSSGSVAQSLASSGSMGLVHNVVMVEYHTFSVSSNGGCAGQISHEYYVGLVFGWPWQVTEVSSGWCGRWWSGGRVGTLFVR